MKWPTVYSSQPPSAAAVRAPSRSVWSTCSSAPSGRVGYFKPIGQHADNGVDPDVQLMKDALGLKQSIEAMGR